MIAGQFILPIPGERLLKISIYRVILPYNSNIDRQREYKKEKRHDDAGNIGND
jgi:hypothetical protein